MAAQKYEADFVARYGQDYIEWLNSPYEMTNYSANISMSCYNTANVVTCFSTDISYALMTHAKSISWGN